VQSLAEWAQSRTGLLREAANAHAEAAAAHEAKQQTEVAAAREIEDHVWFEDRWMVASLCDE
jgi:hypothetical protein